MTASKHHHRNGQHDRPMTHNGAKTAVNRALISVTKTTLNSVTKEH